MRPTASRLLQLTSRRRAMLPPQDKMPKHYVPLYTDPAIERWAQVRQDMYLHFRITKRNALPILAWIVAMPLTVFYFVDYYHNKYTWPGQFQPEGYHRYPAYAPQSAPLSPPDSVQEARREAWAPPPSDDEEEE